MTDALSHPYLDEGRLRYHACMCRCCWSAGGQPRQYTQDYEPTAHQAFDDTWERELTSVVQVKGERRAGGGWDGAGLVGSVVG